MKSLYKNLSVILIITLMLPCVHKSVLAYAMTERGVATDSDVQNEIEEIDEDLLEDILPDEVLIDDLHMVERGSSFLNKEQAFSYILEIIGKDSKDIDYRERLFNTQEIPIYELLVFVSGGYTIYMPDYAIILEFSDSEEVWHPYQDVIENKKYYAGPMIYLYEEGDYVRNVNDDIEVYLESYAEVENLILDYARRMGKQVGHDSGTPSDATASYSDATASTPDARVLSKTSWVNENVIADEWGFLRMPFGYNTGFGRYPNGTCGILASSMLLTYYHKFHEPFLPAKLIPLFDAKPPAELKEELASNQNVLHDYLLVNYAHQEFLGGSTSGYDIEMLNNYIGNELKDSNIHATRTKTNMDIIEAIDNNKPVAIYGLMSNDPNVPGGKLIPHAVLAYGYNIEHNGNGQDPTFNMYKMHYGWHHSSYVDNDGSSSQFVRELWVSPFAVQGGIIIEETVDHTHEAYDITENNDKYGNHLFSCRERSCNALISDDYPNSLDHAEYIWLGNNQITQSGAINYEEDIDYFRVYVSADGMLTVCADFDNPVTGELRIYDKDGNELRAVTVPQSGSNGKEYAIERYMVEQGTYYVSISSDHIDKYRLDLSLISDGVEQNSDDLVLLDTQATNNKEIDYYQIEVPHKGRITIEANFDNQFSGYLYLYDETGTFKTQGAYVPETEKRGYRINYLVEPGTHQIRICSNHVDHYHLKATLTSKDDYGDTLETADTIELNRNNEIVLQAKANYDQDTDYFRIEVPHKGRITVRSDFENEFSGYLYLYNEAGSFKAQGSYIDTTDKRGHQIDRYLVEPGIYYIRLYSRYQDKYQLSVLLTPKDDYGDTLETADMIWLGFNNEITLEAQANYDQDNDYFKIKIPHKGRITIRTDFENKYSGYMYLYNEAGSFRTQGTYIAGTDNKGYWINNYLVEPGIDYIRTYSKYADFYQLNITLTSRDDYGDSLDDAGLIEFDSNNTVSLNGKANYDQDNDYFKIVVSQKGNITVKADFEQTFSGYLYFYDAAGVFRKQGSYVTGTDNKSYWINDFSIERGVYYIRLCSNYADNYQLSVSLTSE